LNLWRVGWYRVQLRLGIHAVQGVKRELTGEIFFNPPKSVLNLPAPLHWKDSAIYFGRHEFPAGSAPPDWHLNPFTGDRVSGASKPWWQISDFESGAGDIKTVWEASRFDWVLAFAQRAATGSEGDLQRLNAGLADWVKKNPAYCGPNWKCGQEASIRVLHLLIAARFLQQDDFPRLELVTLIEAHLARIAPTIDYAVGQDNNHATSEAAALFAGGAWLLRQGVKQGDYWSRIGRQWLENRVAYLVEPAGSFSQHSVNYHRLMLDTLSTAEAWRGWLKLPQFSETFYERAKAATRWLCTMTDSDTGDPPNLGANDGANLLPLTNTDYRDYRPSAALASALFLGKSKYSNVDQVRNQLSWLGLNDSADRPVTDSRNGDCQPVVFQAAGYIVLRKGEWKALFRYPYYRFRPGHCDALHVDLWHGSTNLLRDAGSFSYNSDSITSDYFTGCAGHNTVQFDDREPMPKVGRFLRGEWLSVEDLKVSNSDSGELLSASAGYRDWQGATHYREIQLGQSGLQVTDRVSGFKKHAVLRWRLPHGEWVLEAQSVASQDFRLDIESNVPIKNIQLVEGWESRYYLERQPVKVLEVYISEPGQLTTVLQRAVIDSGAQRQ
jgi:hypothetical protein